MRQRTESNMGMMQAAECGPGRSTLPSYVLITPARNEAAFIEQTIRSVVSQTSLPLKWIIVSDGSTDGTDDIVMKYAAIYDWIELVRMPEKRDRDFAGKVHAFNAGYAKTHGLDYEVIGSLDADISFEPEYFTYLMGKFSENPRLGVGGTPFREGSQQYDYRYTSIEHVSGACQLFRRKCFEEIGGYIPIKGGGIDLIAVTTARMRGWKTRTFTYMTCNHQRKIGTAKGHVLKSKFRFGKQDYYLGAHPVWEVFRCIYQIRKRPFLLGAVFLFAGYSWAFINRVERPISDELFSFRRKEQLTRLKRFFGRLFGNNKTGVTDL